MAMQKVDIQKSKHEFNTVKRVIPQLVNRTNKCQRRELITPHLMYPTLTYIQFSRGYPYF